MLLAGTFVKKFLENLDRFRAEEEEVSGFLLRIQYFVRSPHFTHRTYFSESGVAKLSQAVVVSSDSITSSFADAPWSEVESQSSGQIIAYLKTCLEESLDGRRFVKDTSEQWYVLVAVRPSSGETTSQYVSIPTVVKESKSTVCPLVLRPAMFLDPAENFYRQEGRSPGIQ